MEHPAAVALIETAPQSESLPGTSTLAVRHPDTNTRNQRSQRPGQPEIRPPAIRQLTGRDIDEDRAQQGEHADESHAAKRGWRSGVALDVNIPAHAFNLDARGLAAAGLRANVGAPLDVDGTLWAFVVGHRVHRAEENCAEEASHAAQGLSRGLALMTYDEVVQYVGRLGLSKQDQEQRVREWARERWKDLRHQ
jgi:hypothetical protein